MLTTVGNDAALVVARDLDAKVESLLKKPAQTCATFSSVMRPH